MKRLNAFSLFSIKGVAYMSEMIDSGFEWLGSIPKSWKSETIRHLMVSRDGGAWGEEPSDDEDGTICMRIADFDYCKGRFKETPTDELTRRKYTNSQIKKLQLQKGDILIEKSGGGDKTPVGRTVLFDKDYQALFANFMERLRFIQSVVSPEYIEYWLRAWYSSKAAPFYINQTTGIQNINVTLLIAKERVFYPNLNAQKEIVMFLDGVCADIDSLSRKINDQISSLEAYKRSLITEAVTKGIQHADTPLESGIEWVGCIPSNWEVMPNKYIMQKKKRICPVYNGEDILSLTMNGVIVRDLDAGGKMPASFDGYQKIEPGNLLMCLFDIDVTPRCIGLIKNQGLTSPAYSQFVMKKGAYAPYYYYYYLMLDYSKELLHMAKNLRHSLTEDQLGAIKTIKPPYEEQVEIAEFLDGKCAKIDRIIEKKTEQLSVLEDYKKSLIYEYVTGKKEVPSA